jgi:sarcosine oxidase subunit gamma
MAEPVIGSFLGGDPQRRDSPLAGWHDRFAALSGSAQIAERPFRVQLDVRADPDGEAADSLAEVLGGRLPTQPNTWLRAGEIDVLWLGPDEWLVLADPGQPVQVGQPGQPGQPGQQGQHGLEAALVEAIGGRGGAVADVSAQRTAITLAGPGAARVLASGCAIDLHPRRAPAGSCWQTLLARTGVIVMVVDDSATSFELLVRSSFADYLAAWLVDAAAGNDCAEQA